MVGITTWRAGEVVWILQEWRTCRNLNELVEKFRIKFPHVERHSLHNGITYVWNRYSKDPSYDHKFTSDEIAVIMEQHFVHRVDLEAIVEKFQEAFPKHDWKQYVDKGTAIDCVIGKFGWDDSTRCIPWKNDEIRFILRNRLKLKSWERLFEVFQTWKKRRDLTMGNLQYLCVTYGYKHLDTKEGLENHYGASLASPVEENLTGSEVSHENPDSKITHHNPTELPHIQVISRTKRKRGVDNIRDEIQVKRVRHLSPQLQSQRKDQETATEVHDLSPSTYQNVKTNVSSSVIPKESLGSLIVSSDKPQSHFTRARVQNTERIEAVVPNNRGYAPIPGPKTSIVQLHPLEASNSQYSKARHHLPGVTPQYNFNYGTGGQYYLMPPRIGESGARYTNSDLPLMSSSYMPHPAPTTANISENHSFHIGYVPRETENNTPLCWQERQLGYTDEYLARSTRRSRDQYDHQIEQRPIQNDFMPMGPLYSSMGVEGKITLPDDNVQSAITNSVPRYAYANHGMIYDPALQPSSNLQLTQAPIPQWQGLIDPALFDDPSSDSSQHQLEGKCLQCSVSAPMQDTNIQPEIFLQQPCNTGTFIAPSLEDNQHSQLNLRSMPTKAMAAPRTTTDEFQPSGSFSFLMSENVQGFGVLAMANPSASTWHCSCEACQLENYNISGQLGLAKFEAPQDLGTTRGFDPSSPTASKEQHHSYLDQNGSSSDWPIIIGDEEFDNSVQAVEEWDIYSATPLHALFPSAEEEDSMFEPDPAVLPALHYPTGEYDAPDILQEVAALGEIPVSEEDILRYSAARENHEIEGGCSTNVTAYGVDM